SGPRRRTLAQRKIRPKPAVNRRRSRFSLRPTGYRAEMATHADVSLFVNGRGHELTVDTRTSLLDLLREHLGLTGAKKGCDHGQCGACTILLDGRRANACLALAVAHRGADVVTIEGLEHPLQRAFVEHDGLQCGYCTPGQICSAIGLLAEL